jgi:hypothetical protein
LIEREFLLPDAHAPVLRFAGATIATTAPIRRWTGSATIAA